MKIKISHTKENRFPLNNFTNIRDFFPSLMSQRADKMLADLLQDVKAKEDEVNSTKLNYPYFNIFLFFFIGKEISRERDTYCSRQVFKIINEIQQSNVF